MKPNHARRCGAISAVLSLALVLAAALSGCGSDDPLTGRPGIDPGLIPQPGGSEVTLSGTFSGAGASSMEAAMDAWRASFQAMHVAVSVNYDPSGSGAGRTQLLAGGALWAGSDAALSDAEIERSRDACGPEGAIDLPIYVSPIAITFNLDGIDSINMSASTVAGIFTGAITRWDAPELAAENPGVALPSLPITPVHRLDDSGTTENFVDWLHANAPEIWVWEPSGVWPTQGGDSAQGTSGVITVVQQTLGAITYADASRVGTLGTVAIGVGDQWVPVSPEGAAIAVDASPLMEGRHVYDMAVALDRTTTAEGAYPLVLVSYAVVCLHYARQMDAEFIQEFIGFVASPAGQAVSAQIAGSAPISETLSNQIRSSLAAITWG